MPSESDQQKGSGADQQRPFWEKTLLFLGGLMALIIVVSVAIAGVQVAQGKDPYVSRTYTETAIVEGVPEGADIVESVEEDGIDLVITFRKTPSEYGIAEFYFYVNGEAEKKIELEPRQTEIRIYNNVNPGDTVEMVAVDGSNKEIYSAYLYTEEVRINVTN